LAKLFHLSPRELRILQMVFGCRPRRAIARELRISPHTVNTHFRHMYRKLGVADQLGLLLGVFEGSVRLCPFSHAPAAPHGGTPE
jgi:DNA-binding CsgD family transcriptional regulator